MENSINEVYQLDIVVLTPLHAGAGSEKDLVKGLDYVQKDGQVFLLNQKKVLQEIDISTLSNVLLNRDDSQLISKLSGKLDKVSDTVYEMPVTSDNDIKSFFRNGLSNKPVLPGSSLKGAIRSILFSYLKNKSQDNEDEVFGKAADGDTFMRFIKISDASFDRLSLSNTKIFNLQKVGDSWQGAWKHGGNQTDARFKPAGFNTLYEVLPPKASSKVTISLADKTFDSFNINNRHKFGDKKENIIHHPIEFLFDIINQHTTEYITKQIAFYNKYPNNETDAIIMNLKSVLDQIPEDNCWCVLKMSAGSGFHSITGDWQYDKHHELGLWTGEDAIKYKLSFKQKEKYIGNKEKFKSRKIAIGSSSDEFKYTPMGFVKIGRKGDTVLKQERLEAEAKAEAEKQEAVERLRIEKQKEAERIELLRKEEAEQLRLETERIKKETEAKQLEAERLEVESLKREADEKSRIERLALKVEEGLSFLETSRDFDDASKKIYAWMKIASITLLPENQLHILLKALIRFYNDPKNREKKKWQKPFTESAVWIKITIWVGIKVSQEWYKTIIK